MSDQWTRSRAGSKIGVVVLLGLRMLGLGSWILTLHARILATCRDGPAKGRATAGQVESLVSHQLGATLTDTYQFSFTDAEAKRQVLKAFWNSATMRV